MAVYNMAMMNLSYSNSTSLFERSSEYWVGETVSRVEEPYTHARVVNDIIFSLIHWLVCAGNL